ncbi:GRIP domain-containing protein RUD3-like [Pyrus ussuriensis x Pyrus communis]|uniref:GRIP domain-containing protein RUD3-like n=1 Tax=Pyrus ussuriensis x Pyrus communis TaxID=2448454 RepID=A0A5N5HD27_9ROSA|nr:GRIP domain-containing protein RUD3-like [Pyrus ussuriensis x Pyrus communis]
MHWYAECACRSERERIVFGKKKAYCTWKNRWCFLHNDWEHVRGVTPKRCVPTHFQTIGTSTKKGKSPMLVPVNDILFHKGARKHRVRPTPRPKSQKEVLKITASKKVIGRKRKYKEEVDSIHWNDLKVAMQPSSFRYVNNCLVECRSTVDKFGELLHENESDRDRMMRLSSYVMTKYDDRLRKVERYKAKFKENKQLVNDAKKRSKALVEAICLKDHNFESLNRQNGENVRLKKQLEATEKQVETTILEVSKVKEELDSALVEVFGLKRSIPTEKNAVVQEFLGSQAFHDAFRPHCIRATNFEKRKWMYRDEMDEYRQRGVRHRKYGRLKPRL